jgi:hypothetical protein
MKYSYGWQKASEALSCMAISSGTLADRLSGAWISLSILGPHKDLAHHIPAEQVERFHRLHARMTVVADEREGSLHATAHSMNEEELRDVASETYELCIEIIGAHIRETGD